MVNQFNSIGRPSYLSTPIGSPNDNCEICRSFGNPPRLCSMYQKYSLVPNTVYCELCGSMMHNNDKCRGINSLIERLDQYIFRVVYQPQGIREGNGGGFRVRRGGGFGAKT